MIKFYGRPDLDFRLGGPCSIFLSFPFYALYLWKLFLPPLRVRPPPSLVSPEFSSLYRFIPHPFNRSTSFDFFVPFSPSPPIRLRGCAGLGPSRHRTVFDFSFAPILSALRRGPTLFPSLPLFHRSPRPAYSQNRIFGVEFFRPHIFLIDLVTSAAPPGDGRVPPMLGSFVHPWLFGHVPIVWPDEIAAFPVPVRTFFCFHLGQRPPSLFRANLILGFFFRFKVFPFL